MEIGWDLASRTANRPQAPAHARPGDHFCVHKGAFPVVGRILELRQTFPTSSAFDFVPSGTNRIWQSAWARSGMSIFAEPLIGEFFADPCAARFLKDQCADSGELQAESNVV